MSEDAYIARPGWTAWSPNIAATGCPASPWDVLSHPAVQRWCSCIAQCGTKHPSRSFAPEWKHRTRKLALSWQADSRKKDGRGACHLQMGGGMSVIYPVALLGQKTFFGKDSFLRSFNRSKGQHEAFSRFIKRREREQLFQFLLASLPWSWCSWLCLRKWVYSSTLQSENWPDWCARSSPSCSCLPGSPSVVWSVCCPGSWRTSLHASHLNSGMSKVIHLCALILRFFPIKVVEIMLTEWILEVQTIKFP